MAVRPFTDTLVALRFGELADELADKLNELTLKCEAAGKSGSLTLKLTLKPGKGGQIEIEDEVTAKLPKEQKGTTLMFATVEGNLQREDPRQKTIPGIRSVTEEAAKPRTAEASTNQVRQVG